MLSLSDVNLLLYQGGDHEVLHDGRHHGHLASDQLLHGRPPWHVPPSEYQCASDDTFDSFQSFSVTNSVILKFRDIQDSLKISGEKIYEKH